MPEYRIGELPDLNFNDPFRFDDIAPVTHVNTAYDRLDVRLDRYVEKGMFHFELDKFASKIYKIITEHTSIDISENEFMSILQKDD